MKQAKIAYFDGKISARREALLVLDGSRITVRGQDVDLSYPVAALELPPGVASLRRTIRLPDGGVCELEDSELLSELEGLKGGLSFWRILREWEMSLKRVFVALVLTVLVVVLFISYGIPFLAHRAAFALPPETEQYLAKETLVLVDRNWMEPSKLDQARKNKLTQLFSRVAGPERISEGYRLEFRSSPGLGANAFALPAGVIIITDELVKLAKNDNEIAIILAHEIGHARHRHMTRHLMQASAAGLVVATLTGDITSLAAALPTVLVTTSFSRDFEREADDAAVAWAKSAGVPLKTFADIMERLEAYHNQTQGGGQKGEKGGTVQKALSYLSTHPDTQERIRRVMREE